MPDELMRARGVIVALAIVGAGVGVVTPSHAAGGVSYHDRDRLVASGRRASLTSMCPASKQVVGGGVDVEGNNAFTHVAGSGPVDGPDADHKPDDGWKGTLVNRTGNTRHMKVIAICDGGTRFKYRTSSTELAAGADVTAQRFCEAGEQIAGGGISVKGGGLESAILSGPDGSDSWIGVVTNDSSKRATVRTTAICSTSVFDVQLVPGTVGPGVELQSAGCPIDTVVVGGGAFMIGGDGLGADANRLVSMYPYGNPGGPPNEGIRVRYASVNGADTATYAICVAT